MAVYITVTVPPPLRRLMKRKRTLLVNSLSKSYAMTGWRVAIWPLAQVIENALKAGQNSITCVAPFIQKAAAFALTDPEIQKVTANMRVQPMRAAVPWCCGYRVN